MIVKSGRDSLIINDILMGEVWLASGQSNMEMPIKGFKSEGPLMVQKRKFKCKFPEIKCSPLEEK